MTTNQARVDGYVECSECGHPLEGHDRDGCQTVPGCTCTEGWTKAEVREVRRREGLPSHWDPSNLAG